eukprot:GHVT01070320.1.p1 GENE.GHVT01070320.1~~GHVT01070320.1.p1  ORF type:complete len:112 (+),score=18.47 GHVT01070320.1:108-443(+)
MMSSTTLWKRLMLPSRFSLFQLAKVYRPLGNGSQPRVSLAPAEEPKGVDAALAAAVTSVGFLEVDLLKGVPVNPKLSYSTPDPYFAKHLRHFVEAHKLLLTPSTAPTAVAV